MSLSTKPLGGMRQRYPEEFRAEKYVTEVLSSCSEQAGFEQYDGPVLEPLALFAAKSGGELVGRQSYTFRDRGDRQVIMRPEMTPSLARMVAGSGELRLPVRWFSMPLCYRYERPQRGRVREFLQYNIDVLGTGDLAAELEIILVLQDIMQRFGAQPAIYRIGWSSRRFMTDALGRCGVTDDHLKNVFSAIDKQDKMRPEAWSELLLDSCDNMETACRIEKLVSVDSVDNNWLSSLMEGSDSFDEVVRFSEFLEETGAASCCFSPGVVRGLDYYTGIVFELMDTGGENRRSLCGGGRYDNLVGLFGNKKISGVGLGMGVLTLTLFLETYGLIPDSVQNSASADVFIAVFSENELGASGAVALKLRKCGLRVMLDVSGKKLSKQFNEASRKGIKAVVTMGPDEVAGEYCTVKILGSGEIFTGSPEEIAIRLKQG